MYEESTDAILEELTVDGIVAVDEEAYRDPYITKAMDDKGLPLTNSFIEAGGMRLPCSCERCLRKYNDALAMARFCGKP